MAAYEYAEDGLPSSDLQYTLESELARDEKLLWTGQPRPGRHMWKTLPIVLFGLPWTAFALFWTYMAAHGLFKNGGDDGEVAEGLGMFRILFPLFGLPFILIGCAMLSAPWWTRRKARRTCYAVTDRRAIIIEARGFRGTKITNFEP